MLQVHQDINDRLNFMTYFSAICWLIIGFGIPAIAEIPSCLKNRFPSVLSGVDPVESRLPVLVCAAKGKENPDQQTLQKMADQQEFITAFAAQGLKQTLLSAVIFKIKTEPPEKLQSEKQKRELLHKLKGNRKIYLNSDAYDDVYDEVFVKKIVCPTEIGGSLGMLSPYDCERKKWNLVFESTSDKIIVQDVKKIAAELTKSHEELKAKQVIWDAGLKEFTKQDPEFRQIEFKLRYQTGGPKYIYYKRQLENREKLLISEWAKQKTSPEDQWQKEVVNASLNYHSVFSLMGTDAMQEWLHVPNSLQREKVAKVKIINMAVSDDPNVIYLPNDLVAQTKLLNSARNEAMKHYQAQAKKFQDQGIVGNEIWKSNPAKVDFRLVDLSKLAISEPENFIKTVMALPPYFNYAVVCESLSHAEKSLTDHRKREEWINRINYGLMAVGLTAMLLPSAGIVLGGGLLAAMPLIDSASNAATLMYLEPERHRAQIAVKMLQKKILDSGSPTQISEYRLALAQGRFESSVYSGVSLLPLMNDIKILRSIIK
jgi:hypothetical protein